MGEVRVVGIRVEQPANQPVLLLRESEGDRYLPIWIGAVEATAIAFAQQGVHQAVEVRAGLVLDVLAEHLDEGLGGGGRRLRGTTAQFARRRARGFRQAGRLHGLGGPERIANPAHVNWLGREGSNLRMAESKSAALPLGDAPAEGARIASGTVLA